VSVTLKSCNFSRIGGCHEPKKGSFCVRGDIGVSNKILLPVGIDLVRTTLGLFGYASVQTASHSTDAEMH
jgi:hypothetical protein